MWRDMKKIGKRGAKGAHNQPRDQSEGKGGGSRTTDDSHIQFSSDLLKVGTPKYTDGSSACNLTIIIERSSVALVCNRIHVTDIVMKWWGSGEGSP